MKVKVVLSNIETALMIISTLDDYGKENPKVSVCDSSTIINPDSKTKALFTSNPTQRLQVSHEQKSSVSPTSPKSPPSLPSTSTTLLLEEQSVEGAEFLEEEKKIILRSQVTTTYQIFFPFHPCQPKK